MSKQTEALKLAIEVFGGGDWHDEIVDTDWADKANNTITVLREALAEQPAQQAEINRLVSFNQQLMDEVARLNKALAEQPAREWVGLDDTDLAVCDTDGVLVARYWERLLREKNT